MTPHPADQSASPARAPRRDICSRRWVVALTTVTVIGLSASTAFATTPGDTTPSPAPIVTTTTTVPKPPAPNTKPVPGTTSTTVPTPTVTGPTTVTPTTSTPTTSTPTTVTPPGTPVATQPASTTPTAVTPTPAPVEPTTVAPSAPAPRNITIYPDEIGDVLATIRYMESRGRYEIGPNKGNASGAYQFIASTWNNYGGYRHAYLAPPHIQDERAAKDVQRFLDQWNNDVSMIPVMWYYPRAAREPALMDVVPVPSAGNVLTIREYQQRWLGIFATISGNPVPQSISLADFAARLGIPPVPPVRDDDVPSIEFPVLGPMNLAAPDCDATETEDGEDDSRADIAAAGLCAEQAPGIIFGVKLQPIRAVVDAVVTAVDDVPGSGRPISMTITDVDGRSYTYAGFNDDNPGTDDGDAPDHLRLTELAEVGTTVWAGQIIGFMGDSDPLPVGVRGEVATDASVVIDLDAVAPHIRLSIHDLDGTAVDAYGPVIDSLFRSGCSAGIGPWSVPPRTDSNDAVTIETTDNDKQIDSEWVITSSGQVTATGWGALISPDEGCPWAPGDAMGPGAAGSTDYPLRWLNRLDLPTDVWISLALSGDDTALTPLVRY